MGSLGSRRKDYSLYGDLYHVSARRLQPGQLVPLRVAEGQAGPLEGHDPEKVDTAA